MTCKDYYRILGVEPNASYEQIARRYESLRKMFDPQRFDPQRNPKERRKAEELRRDIDEAFSVLSDPTARKLYDQLLSFSYASSVDQRPGEQPTWQETERREDPTRAAESSSHQSRQAHAQHHQYEPRAANRSPANSTPKVRSFKYSFDYFAKDDEDDERKRRLAIGFIVALLLVAGLISSQSLMIRRPIVSPDKEQRHSQQLNNGSSPNSLAEDWPSIPPEWDVEQLLRVMRRYPASRTAQAARKRLDERREQALRDYFANIPQTAKVAEQKRTLERLVRCEPSGASNEIRVEFAADLSSLERQMIQGQREMEPLVRYVKNAKETSEKEFLSGLSLWLERTSLAPVLRFIGNWNGREKDSSSPICGRVVIAYEFKVNSDEQFDDWSESMNYLPPILTTPSWQINWTVSIFDGGNRLIDEDSFASEIYPVNASTRDVARGIGRAFRQARQRLVQRLTGEIHSEDESRRATTAPKKIRSLKPLGIPPTVPSLDQIPLGPTVPSLDQIID